MDAFFMERVPNNECQTIWSRLTSQLDRFDKGCS
jgi:hypothetical protein